MYLLPWLAGIWWWHGWRYRRTQRWRARVDQWNADACFWTAVQAGSRDATPRERLIAADMVQALRDSYPPRP